VSEEESQSELHVVFDGKNPILIVLLHRARNYEQQYDRLLAGLGMILTSVCNVVHCGGAQGRCRG